MAIPKPEPSSWQVANAQELRATDREVLTMLRDARKRVDAELKALLEANRSNISDGVKRARLEQSRLVLMREQATVFERLGRITEARRLKSAVRAQRLSAAADAALLRLVGRTADAQTLYDAALQSSQQAVDVALQRMRFSAVPLARRVYNTGVWMNGRLNRLINETLASGLNAREFARKARDWFNPNTPGGIRYAAMRLARTEINNAFHSMTIEKAAAKPWVEKMEWNLSKSHPAPDICNKVAELSPYPADKVPARPHPQCMCYVTEAPVDEDDWIDRFVDGEFDDYLDDELEKAGVSTTAPQSPPADTSRAEAGPSASAILNSVYGDRLHTIPNPGMIGKKHLEDLEKIPLVFHRAVNGLISKSPKGGIFIGDKAVPELSPEAERLKGVRPRGWPEGKTWDVVPGAFDRSHGQILLGGGDGNGHGCSSLANHEFAHAFYDVAGDTVREEFRKLYYELHGLVSINPYMNSKGNPTGFLEEAFAEMFAAWSLYKDQPPLSTGLHGAVVPMKSALSVRHPTAESVPKANEIVIGIIKIFEGLSK